MTPIATLKAASKRAKSLGRPVPFDPAFLSHPLAGCMSNYFTAIEVELALSSPDWLAILIWLHSIAVPLNTFIDNHQINTDPAAQYWLHYFATRCDCVCVLEKLPSKLGT